MTGSAETSNTYVRKVASGVYEFGHYVEPKNFRKGATVYTPAGTASSVAEAERQRSLLAADECLDCRAAREEEQQRETELEERRRLENEEMDRHFHKHPHG
ncbi:hypothetical protein [Mesorhizobium sp. M7A.F.Ca.MR.362.00.0.0]|uniref:hypothetical protein n=1 Tax=Mesorhizobium sp. M7A.F.Ca.MR.362.00.0.0 TaxID=2496779 RepID=UPI000FD34729|nr:hypothetical protein [Mesorhizobium sp. M7A.F.Ca.MR.362.00.0.0]RUU80488.1 hypothetical protein EOC06_12095 [Mesorhizobium sp. M7A.F.Ca.MR.362.00.0.0]